MVPRPGPAALQDLLRARRLQRVKPDETAARRLLTDAERHLASAETLLETDVAGSFTLVYDAARKSLAAVLIARGFRATSSGGHLTTAEAAGHLGIDVTDFEWMRVTRNATEYGSTRTPPATESDVAEGLTAAADLIVQARTAIWT